MGLDMYLKGNKFYWTDWKNPDNNLYEDGFKLTNKWIELGYWRKHPNLHGFIVKTFNKNVDDCNDIYLNEDDLKKIIDAINKADLPHTEGFFFGKSFETEDQKNEDIALFEKAIEWLKTKEENVSRSVYYCASW